MATTARQLKSTLFLEIPHFLHIDLKQGQKKRQPGGNQPAVLCLWDFVALFVHHNHLLGRSESVGFQLVV